MQRLQDAFPSKGCILSHAHTSTSVEVEEGGRERRQEVGRLEVGRLETRKRAGSARGPGATPSNHGTLSCTWMCRLYPHPHAYLCRRACACAERQGGKQCCERGQGVAGGSLQRVVCHRACPPMALFSIFSPFSTHLKLGRGRGRGRGQTGRLSETARLSERNERTREKAGVW